MSVDAILEQVEKLTEAERADLLDRLYDRYEPEPAVELSDEMKALLDERSADADANPGVGYTWEEVVAYVKRKK